MTMRDTREIIIAPLPIVTSCDGCRGSCCRQQSSPPGYLYLIVLERRGELDRREVERAWPGDLARIASLTAEVRAELDAYLERCKREPPRGETPCIWLDEETGRCRHYEHRPSICRDLAVGSEGCLHWRKEYGIR